ncbi:uncharacterized protein LOC123257390 [Drosophila ananassae]|uniref:uncharacterized protein LOC123257390 n=1 Tax=Drosophila ananassae TaxID=7217 RepID=UPI001CFF832C|nr:uncharacterized protein LOC123257390 [Drosophila ananassae]
MNLKTIILALLINSKILDVKLEYSLKPLDNLIKNLRKDSEIELIFELQNSEARNCKIDDWNSIGIPILRFNNLEKIEVGKNFNSVHTIGLVCITRESDLILLENLAMAFEGMRQERIILWLQMKPTLEIFKEIGNLSEEHNFIDMIVMEAVTSENATDYLYRLQPFPRPHFTRGLYQENQLNYLGKNATVKLSYGIYGTHDNSYSQTINIPITSEEDRIFVEFAIKYNLSLNLLTNAEPITKVDINLDKKLKHNYMDSANPFITVALLVMVPCAKEKTIQDIILFEVNWWALPLFVMYIIVVILERIILRMNRRIYGGNYRPNLSSLVNLRVFAAILGLKFSGSRRWNFSLRHLFLLLSIFGFLFERFFIYMWTVINKYQEKFNRKTFCNYENLQLISSSTKMQILRKNSVLKKPLTKHVQNLFESGITDYWLSINPLKYISMLNVTFPSDEKNYLFPLSFKDLHFLWILLILGYSLAVVVFYIEVFCILWC